MGQRVQRSLAAASLHDASGAARAAGGAWQCARHTAKFSEPVLLTKARCRARSGRPDQHVGRGTDPARSLELLAERLDNDVGLDRLGGVDALPRGVCADRAPLALPRLDLVVAPQPVVPCRPCSRMETKTARRDNQTRWNTRRRAHRALRQWPQAGAARRTLTTEGLAQEQATVDP